MITDLDTRPDEVTALGNQILQAKAASEPEPNPDSFARSRGYFEALVSRLEGDGAAVLTHAELEEELQQDARELFRRLYEGHLDERAAREHRHDAVVGSDGARRNYAEPGHERSLTTVFGDVRVSRIAYRSRGSRNLCPADGLLNLPIERRSHGLRRLGAIEATRGSFEEAADAVERSSGQRIPKRQLERLARSAAVDFEEFYAARQVATPRLADALVISCDDKGVVMRSEALREATRRQTENAKHKLKTRLSSGEKRNRKRIAEVGAVYEIEPVPRTAADLMPANDAERGAAADAPSAKNKWLTASVVEDAATVVARLFDEAERRDPEHIRFSSPIGGGISPRFALSPLADRG